VPDIALDDREVGPAPLRRAVLGLLLGLSAGAVAAGLLPRERQGPRPAAHVHEAPRR
jgi:hypothetical protein